MIPDERPIFVIGAPRSGTTLLRFMLCSHPRIYIPPESYFIPRFFQRHPCSPMKRDRMIQILLLIFSRYRPFIKNWQEPRPAPEAFIDSLPDLTAASFIDALYSQYARQFGKKRWGDKSPTYTGYVELLARIFPTAQFIHIIRDGRDVALSTLDAYRQDRYYVDLYYAAWTWKQRVRRAFGSAAKLAPNRYYELRYEDLTTRPEPLLRDICAFLGEEYVPEMTEPHRVARQQSSSKGVHATTREPLTTKRVARWRWEMSLADQRLFQAVAGDLLDELGYGTVRLGRMTLADRARYAGLRTKYIVLETGRRVLQTAGLFDPH